jgi:large subunit ribosomal protein L17
MFRNMVRSLLTHERIRTTEAKAKELRSVVEKLITLGKRDDVHSRRLAYKVLENHTLVKKLFDDIAPRFAGVPGGFSRVVKMGLLRTGDAARMAVIELTAGPATAATPKESPVPAAPEPVETKE